MRLSKFRPSRETRLELSTTAMIDVVFLLLIFFLVTTTFFRPERHLDPNIKVQQQSGADTMQDIEPAVVDVLRIDGQPRYRLGTLTTGNISRIFEQLQQFPNKSKGAYVRLSDDVPYGMAAQAINACRQSGFNLISFMPLR